MLGDSTIGQHVRHILEFYICLLTNNENVICYDERKRDLSLETDFLTINQALSEISKKLDDITIDKTILLKMSFIHDEHDETRYTSSLFRELVYCLEHSIHHEAIIKIAVSEIAPSITLNEQFGIAHSTLLNQLRCAQ